MTSIDSEEDYFNKNIPKVVVRNDGNLLYISRSGLPANKDGTSMPTMKQVCIYAFPKPHLKMRHLTNNPYARLDGGNLSGKGHPPAKITGRGRTSKEG